MVAPMMRTSSMAHSSELALLVATILSSIDEAVSGMEMRAVATLLRLEPACGDATLTGVPAAVSTMPVALKPQRALPAEAPEITTSGVAEKAAPLSATKMLTLSVSSAPLVLLVAMLATRTSTVRAV